MNRLIKYNIILTFTLLFLLFESVGHNFSHAAETDNSFDPQSVEIAVEHGIALPWGKPGFRITISGWLPEKELSIKAISPTGEEIDLVSVETPLHADENGNMTVDIDYERKGLAQGHWIILIAGEPGIHVIQTNLPRVEPPTESNPNWKLTF